MKHPGYLRPSTYSSISYNGFLLCRFRNFLCHKKMKTLRVNDEGGRVLMLHALLGLPENGRKFNDATEKAVREFQSKNALAVDGIVGYRTWESLLFRDFNSLDGALDEDNYYKLAFLLDCDAAAVYAVKRVESGRGGGFLQSGKPVILFEGHIFWKQLATRGINPASVQKGNEDILYEKWTKEHYLGGEREYERLEKARAIDRNAADSSASWGMFQVMGFNHKACGEDSVCGFVEKMSRSELDQMMLSARFIHGNIKMRQALSRHNWADFASLYNGPGYKSNNYDIRLAEAYEEGLAKFT